MHYKLWNASPPGFWAFMTSCWRPLPWVYHLYLCRPPGVSHWLNAHPKPGGYDPLWKDTGLSSRLLIVKHRQPSLGSINVWPAKPSFNEDAFSPVFHFIPPLECLVWHTDQGSVWPQLQAGNEHLQMTEHNQAPLASMSSFQHGTRNMDFA